MKLESRDPNPYLFGDTDIAAERLRLLADVFAPSTRDFLARLGTHKISRIADLGCGPGHTTRLLAEVFRGASVVGLDSSEHFIDLARRTHVQRVAFQVADVTAPLPSGPYDLVYSRYLLTHIAAPRQAIAGWAQQLAAGGLIAIEENEWIHTTQPAFARYLSIVEAMLAEGGQRLYVGAQLAQETSWPSMRVVSSDVAPIPARDTDTARIFVLNIANWRDQPFIKRTFPASEINALHRELEQLARSNSQHSSITFGRRCLVLATNET